MPVSDIAVQINKLISGACAVVYCDPDDVAAPTNLSDILDLATAGGINADWTIGGATVGGAEYGFDVKGSELKIDQRTAAVFRDVDDVARTFKTTFAELSAELWALAEQGTQSAIAAAPGTSAQKLVRSGAISEFARKRVAFIAQRRKSQGVVTVDGLTPRGCWVVGGFYSAELAGSSSTKFESGALAGRSIEYTAFPDATLVAGVDTMFYFEEQPGDIDTTP